MITKEDKKFYKFSDFMKEIRDKYSFNEYSKHRLPFEIGKMEIKPEHDLTIDGKKSFLSKKIKNRGSFTELSNVNISPILKEAYNKCDSILKKEVVPMLDKNVFMSCISARGGGRGIITFPYLIDRYSTLVSPAYSIIWTGDFDVDFFSSGGIISEFEQIGKVEDILTQIRANLKNKPFVKAKKNHFYLLNQYHIYRVNPDKNKEVEQRAFSIIVTELDKVTI